MDEEFKRSKVELDAISAAVQRRLEDVRQELSAELSRLFVSTDDADDKIQVHDEELERIRKKLEMDPGPLMKQMKQRQDAVKKLLGGTGGGRGSLKRGMSSGSKLDRSDSSMSKPGLDRRATFRRQQTAGGGSLRGADKHIILSKKNSQLQSIQESKYDSQDIDRLSEQEDMPNSPQAITRQSSQRGTIEHGDVQ